MVSDPMTDDRELLARKLRAKSVQALVSDRRALLDPALEGADFARERVEYNYHLCDLMLIVSYLFPDSGA